MKKLPKSSIVSFFIVSFLTFSFIGCSSSDDKPRDISSETFLEKYDGTLQLLLDNQQEVYFYFQNNLSNPVIKYGNIMDTCYSYTVYESPYFTIEENSIDTLIINEFYSDTEYYITTFSVSEEILTRTKVEYYNGDITTWNDTLFSSQRNIDTFTPICD